MLIAKESVWSIQNYLSDENHPCLILLGEKSIGKRLIANQIASALLRTERLEICPDFLDVQSENGTIVLENLDKLKRLSQYCAVTAPQKVFIIDDAEGMNVQSQNSMLKIIEDGNATNIFIFVANKPLLDTIHSRCVTIRINTPSDEEVNRYFEEEGLIKDDMVMKMSGNRIGLYNQLMDDKEFVERCKKIVGRMIAMQNKRELFEAFGLIKEKDSNNFYECYPFDKVQMMIGYLKLMMRDVLYDYIGIPADEKVAVLKSHYSQENCIAIIEKIDSHLERMKVKGQYSKNDFFDLIRYMVTIS